MYFQCPPIPYSARGHFIGPDLDFKGLAGRSDQRRVQGLIHVCLRHGNVVLETPGDRFIHLVDGSKHSVAVANRTYDDTDSKEVIYLLEGFMLIEHLAVNAEKVLDAAVNDAFDTGSPDVFLLTPPVQSPAHSVRAHSCAVPLWLPGQNRYPDTNI